MAQKTPYLERMLEARAHRVRALMAEHGLTDELVAQGTGLKKRTVQRALYGAVRSADVVDFLARRIGPEFLAVWQDTGRAAA